MRCYFIRAGSIADVVLLEKAADEELIRQAMAIYERNPEQSYDSLEVWDGNRFVYRYIAATKTGETFRLPTAKLV